MAKKKNNPKATSSKETAPEPVLEKIAGKLGRMTGEIIVAKNSLVNMAGGAMDTVKEKIQTITEKKDAALKEIKAFRKNAEKKIAPAKKRVEKAVKATVKKVETKVTPAKKTIKKAAKQVAPAKKAVKAAGKKAAQKVAPAKKAIKKAVKKVTGKK